MHAKSRLALSITVGSIALLMVYAVFILRRGFSSRDEPSLIESVLARGARRMATPKGAKEMRNPVISSPEVLAESMAHFADHCAFCHGNDGRGDTPIGKGLYPKPPDLRATNTQSLTDGELFYIIHNGVRLTGMPAFGDESSGEPDMDSWKLVHFIRHLPGISEEELEKMKDLNPKTPDEIREEEEARSFLQGEPEKADEGEPKGHKHH